MTPNPINEDEIEQEALSLLKDLGYSILFGPDISPETLFAERKSYSDVVFIDRLRNAITDLNPDIPEEGREDALNQVLRTDSPDLLTNNRRFHEMLINGVPVEYRTEEGRIKGDSVVLIDFQHPKMNEFLAVNQFTVIENDHNRRPDIVLFVNGLPLGVVELKNPADENATVKNAFQQLQTYKHEIPTLFTFNEVLIISDGLEARAGTISADWERFMPWKTIGGEELAPSVMPEMKVLFDGMLRKDLFLDLIHHFIVYEDDGTAVIKKMAAYHQYHAVNKAIVKTHEAVEGNRQCGVVWHTQGSGKSLIMVFYTGKLVLDLDNPTIVVLTDRNDLDDQLFGTFANCSSILRQNPVQAGDRDDLKEKLKVASGGIVFTTIQKFLPEAKGGSYPMLSERKNIVVIADEAHRSQYDFIDGFARHMRDALPNASFIGFTGTPIELGDRNTRSVFGDYIDIYDIEQAVKDGATVRIYYESRLAKLELIEEERPKIDPEFEELTESEEITRKEKLKSKWARLEALVGSEKRVKIIAKDIIDHFDQRSEQMDGKAMIVCMSRRICVDLHDEIKKLRPEWYHENDEKGFMKVIMTGSASDPVVWQEHIRNKARRRKLGDQMKDPDHPMTIAIVRDMWLTGFDCPSLHTMYLDKPIRAHGLMQTIARVNRVYKDKPGGLIVDYLGVAHELKKALNQYSNGGGKGQTHYPIEEAVEIMLEQYEIVSLMLHGFDHSSFYTGTPTEKLTIIRPAMEYVLGQEEGKERYLKYVTKLSRAFALAGTHDEAKKIRDDVAFYQAVKAAIAKMSPSMGSGLDGKDIDSAIKQIVSKAISTEEVLDIFEVAGIRKPEVSILSQKFLEDVKGMPQKNLAFELLRKLIHDEIRIISRKNLIQSRSFSDMLEKSIKRYHNRSIEAAEIIEELIELARKMNEARKRGEELGLTEEELALYDSLEVNDSAVAILGDDTLLTIARELVETIRRNVSIDWTLRESVQAQMRVAVKRILRKYGYPPDKQESATQTVLKQASLICADWASV